MPLLSHVMTASHLQAIQKSFDNGIVYHITIPEKVEALKQLVNKYNRKLDYGMPTSGTAFLRLNYAIKQTPNKESWQMGGGALCYDTVDEQIAQVLSTLAEQRPDVEVTEQLLTAWIINEWERYSVVFELNITVKEKQ